MDIQKARRRDIPTLAKLLTQGFADDPLLAECVKALRSQGEIVVEMLPGETQHEGVSCNRKLIMQAGEWIIQAIDGN